MPASINTYTSNLGLSILHLTKSAILGFPKRSLRLLEHCLSFFETFYLFFTRKIAIGTAAKNVLLWFLVLLFKILDCLAIGEIASLLWQIFSWNCRQMNAIEIREAQKVFGNSIPYQQIRIDERSIMAKLGAFNLKSKDLGVCTFYTINFTRPINPLPGDRDMTWLIHELVHIAQMEHVGSQYMFEALLAQGSKEGYNYGPPSLLPTKKLKAFNREQQGAIPEHYYKYILYGAKHPRYGMLLQEWYEPHIQQLREGKL